MSTVSTDQTPQPPAANLSVQDLQNLLIVVELASQRGAFRAQELSSVGTLYDRVSSFLAGIAPPPADQPDTQAQPEPQVASRPPEVIAPIMQQPIPVAPVVQQPIPMAPVASPPPFAPKVVL